MAFAVCVSIASVLSVVAAADKKGAGAKDQKFEEYRAAIKKEY